jgi:hypothetical protein
MEHALPAGLINEVKRYMSIEGQAVADMCFLPLTRRSFE